MEEPISVEVVEESLKRIRKFRKKLRQIERLERSGRDLTTDEKLKIATKDNLRSHLQKLLASINRQEESFNSSLGNDAGEESSEEEFLQPSSSSISEKELFHASASGDAEKSDATVCSTSAPVEKVDNILVPNEKSKVSNNNKNEQPSLTTASKSQQTKAKEKRPKLRSKLRKLWRNRIYSVIALNGHNDATCDVSAYGGWMVSGSRDTSVKLWEISSKQEIRNMSGHMGAVTAVQILDEEESNRLRNLISAESDSELMHDMSVKEFPQELLLVTASTDCYVKLWLLPQGFCIKSIYNYSPITALCHKHNFVFLGSDSGKLTVFNLLNRQQLYDVIIHDDTITSLQCNNNMLTSTSNDGNLKVWEFCNEDKEPITAKNISNQLYLKPKFNLMESDFYVESRQILCSCLIDNKLFYGDDGVNVKVFDLTAGTLTKLCNHKSPGFTDSCFMMNELIFTTSFDLDTGEGSVNIRTNCAESPLAYVASLSCDEFSRFTCATHDPTLDENIFFTGGASLLLWKPHPHKNTSETTLERNGLVHVKGGNIAELSKSAVHSDVESDSSDEETDSGSWWWSKKLAETGSKQIKGEQDESESDSDESEAEKNEAKSEIGWTDWCSLF